MIIHNTFSSLYYKLNSDKPFDEQNKVLLETNLVEPGICSVNNEFSLKSSKNNHIHSSFRFDPYEGFFGVIQNIKIFYKGVEYPIQDSNAIKTCNGKYLFLTADPIFYFNVTDEIDLSTAKINISFDFFKLNNYHIENLFLNKNELKYLLKRNALCKRRRNFLAECSADIKNIYFPKKLKCKDREYKKKKQILYVVWDAPKGGSTLLALNITKELSFNSCYEPIVLLLSGGPLEKEFMNYADVYIIDSGFAGIKSRLTLFKKLIDMLVKLNVKKALLNSLPIGDTSKYLTENGIACIQLVHEMPEVNIFTGLEDRAKCSFEYSRCIIFPSFYVKKRYEDYFEIERHKCSVIPYGIYLKSSLIAYDDKKHQNTNLKKQLKIKGDSKVVLGCGTNFFVKGVDFFINTAVRVVQKDSRVHFVWLGDINQNYDQVCKVISKTQIKNANIEQNFHFVDYTDDPSLYFEGSDIYFLSSRNDTYPSSVLEAMYNYCPVILNGKASGIQDIIKNGYNGFIVDYCDFYKASELIFETIDESNLRDLAINAHRTVKNYTMSKYIKNIIHQFDL